MSRVVVWCVAIAVQAALAGLAQAGDPARQKPGFAAWEPPFVRSERAQRVWDSGACWSECGAYCAWGQSQCLQTGSQSECLALTDRCDRLCQRKCRGGAGPFLPID